MNRSAVFPPLSRVFFLDCGPAFPSAPRKLRVSSPLASDRSCPFCRNAVSPLHLSALFVCPTHGPKGVPPFKSFSADPGHSAPFTPFRACVHRPSRRISTTFSPLSIILQPPTLGFRGRQFAFHPPPGCEEPALCMSELFSSLGRRDRPQVLGFHHLAGRPFFLDPVFFCRLPHDMKLHW